MSTKIKENKWIILLLITGAVYFCLKYLTEVVGPILLAVLFVTMCGPLLKKLKKNFKINRQIGAALLLVLLLIIFGVLIWILGSWALSSISGWIERADILENGISSAVGATSAFLAKTLHINGSHLEDLLIGYIRDGVDYLQTEFVPGLFADSIVFFKKTVAFAGFLLTFIIASVLLAKDYDDFMNKLLDNEEYHILLEVTCSVVRYIATYLKAQLLIMLTVGGFCVLVLTIAGVEYGVLCGMLAGVLDAFPFIGTGTVIMPLAVIQFAKGFYGKGIACLVLYGLCILLRQILEPKLIGSKMGIRPVMVLIAIYSGIQLFGISGIIKGPLGFVLIYEISRNFLFTKEKI